jgi:CO dehydrogenase nickel-insertion accessory protein CooC1
MAGMTCKICDSETSRSILVGKTKHGEMCLGCIALLRPIEHLVGHDVNLIDIEAGMCHYGRLEVADDGMMHIFFSLPHTQALRAAFSAKDILHVNEEKITVKGAFS